MCQKQENTELCKDYIYIYIYILNLDFRIGKKNSKSATKVYYSAFTVAYQDLRCFMHKQNARVSFREHVFSLDKQ